MKDQPRLLDQVRSVIRVKHYSIRTEKSYSSWIKQFIRFHNLAHPKNMGAKEVQAFLSYLAVTRNVSASTQNQALCAILFLYRDVLKIELEYMDELIRAKRPTKISVVFTRDEAKAVINHLDGTFQLMTQLLYGSGLRLMECVRLRVKDIEFKYKQIYVRDGKAAKDRVVDPRSGVKQRHHINEKRL